MLRNHRIIWDDNSSLVDLSASLNDVYASTVTLALTAAQDKVYIGSDLPFNHRYISVSTVNDQTSAISVEIYDGSTWNAAVDVIDESSVSGVTLAQSGNLSWVRNRNESWGLEETTEDITALSSLKIYDLYWVRLTFSADLNASTALKYVGFKFCEDNDFLAEYPGLLESGLKTAFQSGKTTWDDQHIFASEASINELRRQRRMWSPNQLLDPEALRIAATHKSAEVIYSALGADYEERRKLAEKKWLKALDVGNLPIDTNEDGRLDQHERRHHGTLYRT